MTAQRKDRLTEAELELISAYLDGELEGELAARVARRIELDPAWQRQAQTLRQVDDLLGLWSAELAPEKFTARLRRKIHRRRPMTYLRWGAPLATAASITLVALFAMMVNNGPARNAASTVAGEDGQLKAVIASLPGDDRFVIENLDWLSDYEVIRELETIEVIEGLSDRLSDAREARKSGAAPSARNTRSARSARSAPETRTYQRSVGLGVDAALLSLQIP